MNKNVKSILLFSFLQIFLLETPLAQQDSTNHQNSSTNFGIGILVGPSINKHPPRVIAKDNLGIETKIGGFVQRELLQNLTLTLGADFSYLYTVVENNFSFYIKVQDTSLLREYRKGAVDISLIRLKIPLRLRLYYLSRERLKIYVEPGLMGIFELNSSRKYAFEKTTYFDEPSQTVFDPPKAELIEEQLVVNKKTLGWSLGLGVARTTRSGRTYLLSIQYQRAELYFEPRKSVVQHLFALEFQFLLQKEKRIKNSEK